MRVHVLLADLDGTLVDSRAVITQGQHQFAVEYLRERGMPEADLPTLAQYAAVLDRCVGGTVAETLECTLGLLYPDDPQVLDRADFNTRYPRLLAIQSALAPTLLRPLPGLFELLEWLGAQQVTLAVVTSASPVAAVRNLGLGLARRAGYEQFGSLYQQPLSHAELMETLAQWLVEQFHIPAVTIVSGFDVARGKPDPEGTLIALQRLGFSAEQAAFLGDHDVDMRAGVAARVPLRIGVTTGFSSATEIQAAGATHLVGSLTEVPGVLVG